MIINTPISVGELIDKITILRIKQQRIRDADKLRHVANELQRLEAIIVEHALSTTELLQLQQQLRVVNEILWDVEDEIRACEKVQDFSDHFVQLARKVYFTNDQRAEIKRQINKLTGSALFEVKSYEQYS